MAKTALTLTAANVTGLFYINRYRFLTITQFAKASRLSKRHAEDVLFSYARRGIVSSFGNTIIPGHGRTPKVYFLKRKGWEMLRNESGIPEELIGSYSEVHQETSWSPQMYHRLRLLDVFIALECAVRDRQHLSLVKTFIEYRRTKKEGRLQRETTDFVAAEETPENRIVPDGAFILENVETDRRALFLVEMDMATERIVTNIFHDRRITLHFKFEQYDRYLTGRRFAEKYRAFGEFGSFTLLFVTLTAERVGNIRAALSDLPADLARYYRFSVFDEAVTDFLGAVWRSRLPTDEERYRLVRN